MTNFELLEQVFSKCNIEAEEKELKSFEKFGALLLEENKKYNLTAIRDPLGVYEKHFADSLLPIEDIPYGAKVIDIGCGAGFPSIPLAIMRPDITVLSLDSTLKKVNFVNMAAEMLGLKNIKAVSARAEELSHSADYRESFDIALSRAMAAQPSLAEYCLPFVKVGGAFLALKGERGEEEEKAAAAIVKKLGGETERIKERVYFFTSKEGEREDARRTLIITRKISRTPKEYPRKNAKIGS